jgi:hypothetical protein
MEHSKDNANYWADRVYFHEPSKGRIESEYSIKIQFDGRRERFSLNTSNREIAGRLAVEIYRTLKMHGWERAIAQFKRAQAPAPSGGLTIGQHLAAVRQNWHGSETTLNLYVRALRRIVSDIENLDPDNVRFDHMKDGAYIWHARVDAIELGAITPARVNAWKMEFLRAAGNDQVAINKRKISINTYLRNAKSLFADKVVKSTGLELSAPRPFHEIDFFGGTDSRYFSKFDIREFLAVAKERLLPMDPDAYSVVLLSAFAGLRRIEIDLLEWPSIDFNAGAIQLRYTEFYRPKTPDSLHPIPVREKWILDWFWARRQASGFVVAPEVPYKRDQKNDYYRSEELLERTTRWLRANGIKESRPLHTLRKEAGNDIVKRAGLIAGAAFLRHTSTTVTSMHYSDYRVTETPSYGDIQQPEEITNIVKFL